MDIHQRDACQLINTNDKIGSPKRYLQSLEKVEYDNEIYYYDKENDFTILQYKINNAGKSFVNTIYITYAEGRIES